MAYAPTHDAPEGGLPAYAAPDPTQAPVAQLDAGLDMQLLERRADWAHIACSNGWETWVDARRLVERPTPTPAPAPAPPPPPAAAPTPAPAPAPTPAPAAAPPSEGWTVPSATAATPSAAGGGLKIGPGQILALVGAALVLVSAWLPWIDSGGDKLSAYEIGSKLLIDSSIDDKGLIGIGFLLLLCTVLIVVGGFVKPVRFLAIVGGGLAVVIALLFVFQSNGFVNNARDDFGVDLGLFDFITYFWLMTVVGGAAAVVGGVLTLTQKQ